MPALGPEAEDAAEGSKRSSFLTASQPMRALVKGMSKAKTMPPNHLVFFAVNIGTLSPSNKRSEGKVPRKPDIFAISADSVPQSDAPRAKAGAGPWNTGPKTGSHVSVRVSSAV